MAQLESVETSLRIYRPVDVSNGIFQRFYSNVQHILRHRFDYDDFVVPKAIGVSLLRSSVAAEARRTSAELRSYSAQEIADNISSHMPITSYNSYPFALDEAYILAPQSEPGRHYVAVGMQDALLDIERGSAYRTLGHLAARSIPFEGFTELRLGYTHRLIPYKAVELIQDCMPQVIRLEPVKFAFFSPSRH
ncbi:MAG: hypothetical protein ABIR37_03115 [Candidatus Saccharimonadales bacterium]